MVTFYKYCKIVNTVPSDDGFVRKVIVEYCIPSLKKKQVCVDVRRLIILPTLPVEAADGPSGML